LKNKILKINEYCLKAATLTHLSFLLSSAF
jgi:hypothetical protein